MKLVNFKSAGTNKTNFHRSRPRHFPPSPRRAASVNRRNCPACFCGKFRFLPVGAAEWPDFRQVRRFWHASCLNIQAKALTNAAERMEDYDLSVRRIVDRSNNHSAKYDERKKKFGTDDVIPLWIADMDFKTAQPIIDALKARPRRASGATPPGRTATLRPFGAGRSAATAGTSTLS